ncbi:30S ribosomal protein THX [Weeksella virosa]|uniref:30S ribosomal protein THX n=1 Tax=Weeksella virosa (strain ATCC 43766 / DSM 16922 / JCM 21250 / CCUG 30538 / CDC 9751 / IAM 14551 / NBRC 16016 / NCTC 11634 / CL345/78) TaxID=865938 RepID=F0P099_WEEVC|nr:30S ribosomal protein THX [Weeksella virosa]ADX68459.1 hypothetical protein Weevi_1768 [Weeksella virosa DSM 16922]MDK7675369.1 30S ribosomal protein THX [Weeksella virosa]SUP54793.1 30S ribosomal protein Thx [Weeksella virosa]VEH63884.1 30S ribosomal protein Thx [Weeksella virosa]
MGKGDLKTRRGKIANGSYGVRRPRKVYRYVVEEETNTKAEKKEKSTAKKSK